MSAAFVANGMGLKVKVETEFNIILHEEPIVGPELLGRVEMTVSKPISIIRLGVFMGLTSTVKLPTGDTNGKKRIELSDNNRLLTNVCPYLPLSESFIILAEKKDFGRNKDESALPLLYTPGVYNFPFKFNLKALEVLKNFDCETNRGQVILQNKIFLFFLTGTIGARLVLYPPSHVVSLPYFSKLEKNWRKPVEKSCCLKKGLEEIGKFTLKLNQQGYLIGDRIDFKVERWVKFHSVRIRDISIELIRKITVETWYGGEGRPNLMKLAERKYIQKIALERKVLASKTNRTNEYAVWESSIVFPDGPPDTTCLQLPIECTYMLEMSVNIFGVIQTLKAVIPLKTGAFWDEEESSQNINLRRNLSVFPAESLISFACFSDTNMDDISLASLPPNYSQLSSRATSIETLPPPYKDLFLDPAATDQLAGLGLGPITSD